MSDSSLVGVTRVVTCSAASEGFDEHAPVAAVERGAVLQTRDAFAFFDVLGAPGGVDGRDERLLLLLLGERRVGGGGPREPHAERDGGGGGEHDVRPAARRARFGDAGDGAFDVERALRAERGGRVIERFEAAQQHLQLGALGDFFAERGGLACVEFAGLEAREPFEIVSLHARLLSRGSAPDAG
jgi:hypothetical protein